MDFSKYSGMDFIQICGELLAKMSDEDTDVNAIKPLFEYVIIFKFNKNYQPEFTLELDGEAFFEHKHRSSRIGVYNLLVAYALIEDGRIIYKKKQVDNDNQI